MTIHNRYRSEVDDRHQIRNPHGNGERDMAIYANTLLKTRIPQLFLTVGGFNGHLEQIKQELVRLERVENLPGERVVEAIHASRLIRGAIKAAKAAAVANHFPCLWRKRDLFHLAE